MIFIAFVEHSPDADLSRVHGTVDRGRELQHQFGSPEAGAKTNEIIAKPTKRHLREFSACRNGPDVSFLMLNALVEQ